MNEVIFNKEIRLDRLKLHEELIDYCMLEDILDYEVRFVLVDIKGQEENGIGEGVMKDVISIFFD